MEKNETRIFVLSPYSNLTPSTLYRYLVSLKLPLKVKETCFGVIVEGEKNILENITKKLREIDSYNIFSKVRAYPPGDSRICRANRGGGPRLGFHFLEFEHQLLPLIGEALKSLKEEEARKAPTLPTRIESKISLADIKKVFDEYEEVEM